MTTPSISSLLPSIFGGPTGPQMPNGSDLQFMAQQIFQTTGPITAHAGGAAAKAVQLNIGINNVATVASDHDSVILPLAVPGTWVVVINNGGHTLDVYPQQANANNTADAGDQIVPDNSVTPGAAGAVYSGTATADTSIFYCYSSGLWKAALLT